MRDPTPPQPGLRAARSGRGWSQSDAARELAALGRQRGAPVATPASLKSLLSRWENGHAVPEPQYRALLGELYGRTPAELGLAGPAEDRAGATAAARFRAAVAAAGAVDSPTVELWWEQLALAVRLDDELGAAGAGELVRAQVEQLDETRIHLLSAPERAEVAAVLSGAAALAGAQALDRGRHDEAWRRYHLARTAGSEAGLPGAIAVAVAGQAAVLVDAGESAQAVALVVDAERSVADAAAGPARSTPEPTARVRLAAARAMASAAAGDSDAAHEQLAAAQRGLRRVRADLAVPRGSPPVELADLHRWHGRALADLRDPGAVTPLERALAGGPGSARHRAAVHADLAMALHRDRPEEAAGHAGAARALAVRIGSERVTARLAACGGEP